MKALMQRLLLRLLQRNCGAAAHCQAVAQQDLQ